MLIHRGYPQKPLVSRENGTIKHYHHPISIPGTTPYRAPSHGLRRDSPQVPGVQHDLLLAHAVMRHVDAEHGEEVKQLRPRWVPGAVACMGGHGYYPKILVSCGILNDGG